MDYILIGIFVAGVLAVFQLSNYFLSPRRDLSPKEYPHGGRVVEGFSGRELKDTPAGKLGASIMNGVCPDCGSKEGFYQGPQGGISTNIFCANPKCRSGFNFTNMFHEGHAERIQNGRDEYYK
jgi:hypothetical protein